MFQTFHAALLFLISTLFDLYIFILIVRLILVYIGSNYYDPVTQFITKLTDFIIKPLRRILPNFKRFETASFMLIIILEMVKFFFISMLSMGFPNLIGLFILSLGDILKMVLNVFFYAILLQAILSWLQPAAAFNHVLYRFTAPILRPFQRFIPPINGVDIAPIPALIILQLLVIMIANPLMTMGLGIAFNG